MKSFVKLSLFTLTSLIILLSACKKSAGIPAAANNNASLSVATGTWTITSFTQRTEDKTGNFSGIDFTFKSDGSLVASGKSSATGTWSSAPASTGYYSSSLATFTIGLGNSSPFNKLSNSWNIAEQSATTLRLDNREAAEDEHVIFSKK